MLTRWLERAHFRTEALRAPNLLGSAIGALISNGQSAPGSAKVRIEAILDDTIKTEEYAKLVKRPHLAKGHRLPRVGAPPEWCRIAAHGRV